MLYHKLFNQFPDRKVYAGIIGAGHFGTAVVTQQLSVPNLFVPIVADKNLENAKSAFLRQVFLKRKSAMPIPQKTHQNILQKDFMSILTNRSS